jgi:hypothetical protein
LLLFVDSLPEPPEPPPPLDEKSWKPRIFAHPTTATEDDASALSAKRDNRAI